MHRPRQARAHQPDQLLVRRLDELLEVVGIHDLDGCPLGVKTACLRLSGLSARQIRQHEVVGFRIELFGKGRLLGLGAGNEPFLDAPVETPLKKDPLAQ